MIRKRERNFENSGLKDGNRLLSVNSFDDFSPWAYNTRIHFARKEKKSIFLFNIAYFVEVYYRYSWISVWMYIETGNEMKIKQIIFNQNFHSFSISLFCNQIATSRPDTSSVIENSSKKKKKKQCQYKSIQRYSLKHRPTYRRGAILKV